MKSKSKKNYMIDFFKDEKNHNREFTLSEYDSEVKKAYEADEQGDTSAQPQENSPSWNDIINK